MKKALIVVAVLVVLILALGIIWIGSPKGPSLESVAHLKAPRISTLPSQKVIQVIAKGNPNDVGKGAFGLLMGTYFKLKGVPKGGPEFKPPRARWPLSAEVPIGQWVGYYAMPVPESITELPEVESKEGLSASLVTWEYGQVAEILHVGGYDKEKPTIEKLKGFIENQGFQITGLHEEEYLRGPGMFFRGNPDTYLTVIRYQVVAISDSSTSDSAKVHED